MLTKRDKNILPGGRDYETAMRLLNEPGAVLQWRNTECSGCWHDFQKDDGLQPLASNLDWRIKPKTLRYRVALFTDGNEHWTETTRNDGTATLWESGHLFRKWLTDWTEVEV